MGRDHWIKGINNFLWNIGVWIHDFVGGHSSKPTTETGCLWRLWVESWVKMLRTYTSKLAALYLGCRGWCSTVAGVKGGNCRGCSCRGGWSSGWVMQGKWTEWEWPCCLCLVFSVLLLSMILLIIRANLLARSSSSAAGMVWGALMDLIVFMDCLSCK